MGDRLNIALLIKDFIGTGGAERYAVETARRLSARGHRIDVYARRIDPELARGMTLFKVPAKWQFSSVLSHLSFVRQSGKMVRKRHYDIVHAHDKGCRADVSTIHTFSYKRGMSNMSLLKLGNELISPRAWLYLHMEKVQVRSEALAAVSRVVQSDIDACHCRKNGVSVILPGVDTDRFSPGNIASLRADTRATYGLCPDEMAVVFIGSEFRRKGLDSLIPAIGKGMRLFVVGRQERMAHYRRLAARCGVEEQVVFTGLACNVLPYYALADVVVLPSVAEAFGMTVLEGMSCGLTVITSHQAGCSCLVNSGHNGFVFESPEEMHTLLSSLRDEDLRQRIGEQARKTALTCTWDKTADRYESLFYALAEKKTSMLRA